MAQLAFKLAEVLRQPVVDRTDVAGRFDLKLEWTPEDMQAKPPSADQRAGSAPDAAAGPSIFGALQEQLGLKLPHRFQPPAETVGKILVTTP